MSVTFNWKYRFFFSLVVTEFIDLPYHNTNTNFCSTSTLLKMGCNCNTAKSVPTIGRNLRF